MCRKLSLAALAAVALGTAALAPTSASAWWHDGWHHGWHGGRGGPGFFGAYGYGGGFWWRGLGRTGLLRRLRLWRLLWLPALGTDPVGSAASLGVLTEFARIN